MTMPPPEPPEPQQPPEGPPPPEPQPAPPPGAPDGAAPLPPEERIRLAYLRRNETDYIFDFWTALGWTLLTCGIYALYIVYQLVRRSRDHNARRLEQLDAANALAWDRANAQGLADELRPSFERTAAHLDVLRRQTTEFRDPTIWLVIAIFASTIVEIILGVLLDQDLVTHDHAEGGAESELAYAYGRLGTPIATPDPAQLHRPYEYVGRVIATLLTCGIYWLWWMYNLMVDGNAHFAKDWAWEDSLAQAVQTGGAA